MTRKARIWLLTVGILVLWIWLAWLIPGWVETTGRMKWGLLGGLALIGTFGAAFTAVFLVRRPPAPPAPRDPLSQEVEQLLAQAERKLIDARVVRGRPLQRIPLIFVLGAKQHHKTSAVVRSNAEAELLAGDVMRGVQVAPTQSLNIWLARPALVVEAALDVLNDSERRTRLLHRLQPAQFAEALTSGEQAARAALVCVSCEAFLDANARARVTAHARELRTTLGEIAHAYGVRLPVYVLFTKADAVPGFSEYAKHLTTEEVRDVLGATLELPAEVVPSAYAEYAAGRVQESLSRLIRALSARRHLVLGRLGNQGDRHGAYQFPRELRRVSGVVTEFLVEFARPSELRVSPFLRGFYFSGVREVLVSDQMPVAGPAPVLDRGGEGGATQLLRALPSPVGARQAVAAAPGSPAMRREAEWVFLGRLFSGVLLNDPVAFGVTRGGARVSTFRRVALGSALSVAALLLMAMTISFTRNMQLQKRVSSSLTSLGAPLGEPEASPTLAQLARLDSLGGTLDVLHDHVHDGVPLLYRWGLSTSEGLYPGVRRRFFQHFASLLGDATQRAELSQLSVLPERALAGPEYQQAYNRLKAYLITTAHREKSDVEYLPAQLLADWPARGSVDSLSRDLGLRQFVRYARELPHDDLDRRSVDSAVVRRVQQTLQRASGEEPIYQALIADASSRLQPFSFGRLQSAGLRTVAVPREIPGAFTNKGWETVHAGLRNIKQYLTSEDWVIGSDKPSLPFSEDSLVQLLRVRYDADYAEQWRAFLRSANVIGFGSLNEASQRLAFLSSSSSELLLLLAVVNDHVPDDSQRVARSFTTVGSLGAKRPGGVLTTEPMNGYLKALSDLASRMQLAAGVTDAAQGRQTYQDAQMSTVAVDGAITNIAAPLDPNEWQALGLGRLFGQPSQYAKSLLARKIAEADKAGGASAAAAAGAAFCEKLSPLTSKRPFVAAGEEVSVSDLAEVLGPNGALGSLAQTPLGAFVQRRGSRFVRAQGGVAVSGEAIAFLNRLATISEALFGSESNEAIFRFEIAPVGAGRTDDVVLTIGGRREVWRPEQDDLRRVAWNLAVDNGLSVGVGRDAAGTNGKWAIKDFFSSGTQWSSDGGVYQFVDSDKGIRFRVRMNIAVAEVLRGEVFKLGIRCPTKWAE